MIFVLRSLATNYGYVTIFLLTDMHYIKNLTDVSINCLASFIKTRPHT